MEKPRIRTEAVNPLRRYIADPGAMGLFAFASITFMSGCLNCGWLTELDDALYSAGVFYGGMVQIVAGILDLLRGEKVSGSTFVAFGFFWVSNGFYHWPGANQAFASSSKGYSEAIGWYLLSWTFIAIASFLGVLSTSILQIILLFLVVMDFGLLSIQHLGKYAGMKKGIGYVLVITAALAYYLGVAFLLKGKPGLQLPIFELKAEDDEESGMLDRAASVQVREIRLSRSVEEPRV